VSKYFNTDVLLLQYIHDILLA